MNLRPWRAKIATLLILFFVGTFAGQLRGVMDTIRGRVDRGARIAEDGARIVGDLRNTVTTIGQVVDGTTEALRAQIADLQGKLAAGTATPAQVSQLQGLLERVRAVAGRSGTPGPAGPSGPPGPPGATAPAPSPPPSSTSTTAGGTTPTTRPPAPTTTTRPRPSSTTTTTRCVAGVGRLVKIGC